MLSLIMGVMFLITSSMMNDIYAKYCEYLKDMKDQDDRYNFYYNFHDDECGKDHRHFLILPIFGYFTMVAWVRCL